MRQRLVLRHEGGGVSNVSYQAGGDRAGPVERVEVFGGGRTGTLDDWDVLELWHGGRRQRVRGGKDKGHAAELAAFVDGCRTGTWPIPWSEIFGVSWAAIMAVRSLREGIHIGAGDEAIVEAEA